MFMQVVLGPDIPLGDTYTTIMHVETKSCVLDSLDSGSDNVSRWEYLQVLVCHCSDIKSHVSNVSAKFPVREKWKFHHLLWCK